MPELPAALHPFLQEHRRCGELEGVDGERIRMACDCGAGIAHPVEPPEQQPAPDGRMKLLPSPPLPSCILPARRSHAGGPRSLLVFYAIETTLAHMAHRWRLTKASSKTDHWRVTCSCGRWRAFTETEADAHRLAEEHGREKGAHAVKIESRDDYPRHGMAARPQHPRSV